MEAGARQLGHTSSPDLISPTTRLFLHLSPLPLSSPLFLPSLFRFSFNLNLLFFFYLFTSSSISPCRPLFSISLFFYLKSFPHLSFSFSSSSSTSTLLFSSFNVLFFLCLYLSSYVIYPLSLLFSSMFLLHLQHFHLLSFPSSSLVNCPFLYLLSCPIFSSLSVLFIPSLDPPIPHFSIQLDHY
jgi:hypothetical protein